MAVLGEKPMAIDRKATGWGGVGGGGLGVVFGRWCRGA